VQRDEECVAQPYHLLIEGPVGDTRWWGRRPPVSAIGRAIEVERCALARVARAGAGGGEEDEVGRTGLVGSTLSWQTPSTAGVARVCQLWPASVETASAMAPTFWAG
jgi:hypothetical protein